jgi:hypothetical protein
MPRAHATVYFNETRGLRFERWAREARMVKSAFYDQHRIEVEDGPNEIERLADAMYSQGNAEVRINGATERSISVGDVIVLEHPNRTSDVLAVERMGYRAIPLTEWYDQTLVNERKAIALVVARTGWYEAP